MASIESSHLMMPLHPLYTSSWAELVSGSVPSKKDLDSRMWVQFVDLGGDTRKTHEEWGRKLEGEGPNKEAISEPAISMGS